MQHVIKQHENEFSLSIGDGVFIHWSRKIEGDGMSHFCIAVIAPQPVNYQMTPELGELSLSVPSRH